MAKCIDPCCLLKSRQDALNGNVTQMREHLEQKDESPFSCQRFGTTGVMFCLFEAKITVARQRPHNPTASRTSERTEDPDKYVCTHA